jgi:bacillithiol biosynthesis deacetylase BshB1
LNKVDVLVFGPHADDVEIGLGGVIARHVAEGHAVGICDVTRAELSSNGTPAERLIEAERAAALLGAAWRENLGLPDGGIDGSEDQVRAAVELIRLARPRVIAVPYWSDRHPDHCAASALLQRAIFKSALRRYETATQPWRTDWTCFYFINDSTRPSFVVDVSAYYEKKREALACYGSQFATDDRTVATRLNAPTFRQLIESRDAQFGALAGVAFAEGVVVCEPIVRAGLMK